MTGETPNPLDVLAKTVAMAYPLCGDEHDTAQLADAALAQVQALAEAAQEVSRIEATGVLPDFMPLYLALVPFPARENTND